MSKHRVNVPPAAESVARRDRLDFQSSTRGPKRKKVAYSSGPLEALAGIDSAATGNLDSTVDPRFCQSIDRLFHTNPSVFSAVSGIVNDALGGVKSLRVEGDDTYSNNPVLDLVMQTLWLEVAQKMALDFTLFGVAVARMVSLADATGPVANNLRTRIGFMGSFVSRRAREILVPELLDFGSVELRREPSIGGDGVVRHDWVVHDPSSRARIKDTTLLVHASPSADGCLSLGVVSAANEVLTIDELVSLVLTAQTSLSNPLLALQKRHGPASNPLNDGNMFFDSQSRDFHDGEEQARARAGASRLEEDLSRYLSEINRARTHTTAAHDVAQRSGAATDHASAASSHRTVIVPPALEAAKVDQASSLGNLSDIAVLLQHANNTIVRAIGSAGSSGGVSTVAGAENDARLQSATVAKLRQSIEVALTTLYLEHVPARSEVNDDPLPVVKLCIENVDARERPSVGDVMTLFTGGLISREEAREAVLDGLGIRAGCGEKRADTKIADEKPAGDARTNGDDDRGTGAKRGGGPPQERRV